MIVLIWIILLVISEEIVKLNALAEVLNGLKASEIFKELKVSVNIEASSNKSMPVDALNFDVSVVFLELEVDHLNEIDVWPLDSVHVFSSHLKLIEIVVFGEYLHICLSIN